MKKNKIGIITFHNAINYGAALQTYALHKYIQSIGKKCEIIDYRCEKLENNYKLINFKNKKIKQIIQMILRFPINAIKKKKFKKFSKRNLDISSKKYTFLNIKEANNYYNSFITGSDQVWNLDITNSDLNYFLKFVNSNNNCFSYAASIGGSIIKDETIFKNELNRFNRISVRETSLKNKLEKITSINIAKVLDPVFLIPEEKWNLIAKKIENNEYIFVYALHEPEVYTIAERISKITGLKIICLHNRINKPIKAKYVSTAGIDEFLGYLKNAKYVVTDSFHGTAFSIIFKKNLKVVLKNKLNDLNERMLSLLEEFGLNMSIVSIQSTENDLIRHVDYSLCNKNIENSINKSKKFLNDILGDK